MTDVWSPLSEEDPVRGDPWRLGELANHFDSRAQTMRDVINGLGRLDTGAGQMRSVAVDELVRRRDGLIPDLRLLEARWETTAGALRRYCPILDQAQEMAAAARRQSWDAQRQIEAAQRALDAAAAAPPPAPVPVPAELVFMPVGPNHEEELRAAEALMDRARMQLEDAIDLRDQGERTAADTIGDASDDDIRNEGGMFSFVGDAFDAVAGAVGFVVDVVDSVGDAIGDAASWVAENWPSLEEWSQILGYVSAGLGLLSLIPIPGFQLFGTLAVAVSAVKLLIDIYLWGSGRQGFGEVGMGLIGLATFGVGRVATSAARGAGAAAATDEIARLARPGALRGFTQTMPDGTKIFGAAARSHRVANLTSAVDELRPAALREGLPRALRWAAPIHHAVSPAGPGKVLLDISPTATRWAMMADTAGDMSFAMDYDQVFLGGAGASEVKEHVFGDKAS